MMRIDTNKYTLFNAALVSMIAVEGLSLLAFIYPVLSLPLLIIVGISSFVLSLHRLDLGVYIFFGELFVGSRGHLLEHGFLSLRLVIFIAVFVAWVISIIKNVKIKNQNDSVKFKIFEGIPKSYWLLLIVIVAGAVYGYLRGNGLANVFFDANGYLYLAMLPAVFAAIKTREQVENIFKILAAAIMIIAAKTLLLFLWFSLGWPGVATAYHWVIDNDLGEITGNVGKASRIFMQSQFWALMGLFIFAISPTISPSTVNTGEGEGMMRWSVVAAALFSIIMSLSRSFWLGGIAGAVFAGIVLLFYFKVGWGRLGKLAGMIILISLIEVGALYAFSKFVGSSDAVGSRTENPITEAAGGARLLLLPELLSEIKESSIIGKGFGEQVSYASYLPDRVTAENPEGRITSFAFEWGYLDTMLKIGLIGLLVYLLFIARIFKQGLSKIQIPNTKYQILGLLSGLVALIVLNVTTPYLNHPLGIGYLILASLTFNVIGYEITKQYEHTNKPHFRTFVKNS